MMIFKDISNFSKLSDYVPILNGTVIVDLIVIFLSFNGFFKTPYLKSWYQRFNLSAVIADVLILVIGIIIARFLYKYIFDTFSIVKFTSLAVVVQIIHDMLFYVLFKNTPVGYSYILDYFKKYAKDIGASAIVGDSLMMIVACLISSFMANFSLNANVITSIVSVYLIPYFIYQSV